MHAAVLLQVDVYSLGCILNECWMRRPPWGREHDHFCQIIMQVIALGHDCRSCRGPTQGHCDAALKTLLL